MPRPFRNYYLKLAQEFYAEPRRLRIRLSNARSLKSVISILTKQKN